MMKVLLESVVKATADSVEREWRMTVLYEDMKVVVRPLQKCVLKVLVMKTGELLK